MFLFCENVHKKWGKQFHVCLVFAAVSASVVVCVCCVVQKCVAFAKTSVSIEQNYAKFMESLSNV